MNIKKIIREEVDDFAWIKETNYDDLLDSYFGITTEPHRDIVKVISFNNDDSSPYVTYKKIKKISLLELYRILTSIDKSKSIFSKDFWEIRPILKNWKRSRKIGSMLSDEVQYILSNIPQDTGPR